MTKEKQVRLLPKPIHSLASVLTLLILLNLTLYYLYGIGFTLAIGAMGFVSLFLWYKTNYREPINPDKALPLYLLLIAALLVHMAEEYYLVFGGGAQGTAPVSPDLYVLGFLITGTTIAVLSAIGLIYRNPLSNYVIWFIIVGPAVFNGATHLLLPLYYGELYAPGSVTAPVPMIIGLVLAARIFRESKQLQRS